MSRNQLLIAGAVLLAAAASLHFAGGPRELKLPPPVVERPQPGATAESTSGAHELVDALVPPIHLDYDSAGAELGRDEYGDLPLVALTTTPVLGPKGWTHVRLHGAIKFGEFQHGERAYFDGHTGNVCASGCAWNSAPTEKLTEEAYFQLLAQYATEPMDETSYALESLLYFGRQTRLMIARHGTSPIDPLRDAFLRRELRKTHAYIEIQMVDEFGVVRTSLPPTLVPLDRRHLFDMDVHDLQPLETSGTVKRVGMYHLWTRL